MSVNRLTDKFIIANAREFTIFSGTAYEHFILPDLRIINDEQLIWDYLRSNGYSRIWFYRPGIGLYFLDKESANLPASVTNTRSNQTSNKKEGSGFKRKGFDPAEEDSENPDNCSNERPAIRYEQKGIRFVATGQDNENFIAQVKLFIYNNDFSEKKALIFMDFDQAFQATDQEERRIWHTLWTTISSEHTTRDHRLNLKYFFFYNSEVEEKIVEHINDYASIIRPVIDITGDSIKCEHFVRIGAPEEDEIRSIINRYRLLNKIDVNWSQLDTIVFSINNSKKAVKLKTLINCFDNIPQNVNSIIDKSILRTLDIPYTKRTENPLNELNSLIGLQKVKEQVNKHLKLSKRYQDEGKELDDFSLHMVFEGNPGTGKTTVARLIAQIYAQNGLLKKGQLIEVDRADLVGRYVGETAQKTRAICDRSLGGVLFIDEAYALADKNPEHGNNFGIEAIDILTKFMEDNKKNVMVIVAGYPDQMYDFINSNPGLKSRFRYTIQFEDYNPNELLSILKLKLKKIGLPQISNIEQKILKLFKKLYANRSKGFENGRLAENIANEILQNRNNRLDGIENVDFDNESIILQDLPAQYLRYIDPTMVQKGLDEALKKLDELIGLDEVKDEIRKFCDALKAESLIDNLDYEIKPLQNEQHFNMIFYGNPGTGKTEVAKILGEHVFKAMGISNGKFKDATRDELVSQYASETAIKTTKVVEKVKGGVLFIDEVYNLKNKDHDTNGQEAINTLVKLSSELKDQLTIIIAGYTAEVQGFLDSNTGLKSRFSKTIQFKNYSITELILLSQFFTHKKNCLISEKLKEKLEAIFRQELQGSGRDFGNARFVSKLIDEIIMSHMARLNAEYFSKNLEPPSDVLRTLMQEDLPSRYKNIRSKKKNIKIEPVISSPFDELDNYVGMEHIKEQLQNLVYTVKWNYDKGIKSRPHIVFKGSPGTGKTIVAKLLGSIFRQEGILSSGHLISPQKEDIVKDYKPEENIKNLIRQAKQGILFIDEAYALATDQQGANAITSLLQYMENDRGDFIVIMAGYEHHINELYKVNPGLKDRIGNEIIFKDYTPEELWEIFELNLKDQDLTLEQGLEERLKNSIRDMYRRRDQNFANARTMEKLLELIKKLYISRIQKLKDCQNEPIRLTDIPEEFRPNERTNEQLNLALSELDSMVGLSNVKNELRGIINQIQADQVRLARGLISGNLEPTLYYVFTGNPGTGKTTVARLFGKILHAMGILRFDDVIEVGKSHLEGKYVGHSAPQTREIVESAIGRVLFIDEAYTITQNSKDQNSFGTEVIGQLVQCMTDPRIHGTTCIIAAGYTEEMNGFLNNNPGLSSRFSKVIEFEDYSNEELVVIFNNKIKKMEYCVSQGFNDLLLEYFMSIKRGRNFGNGRLVDNLIHEVIKNLNARLAKIGFEVEMNDDLMKIILEDLPSYEKNKNVTKSSYVKKNQINTLTIETNYPNDFKIPGDLKKAVGYIESESAEGTGTGSGFIINREGYVITCYHVVENSYDFKFYPDGSENFIEAKPVYKNKNLDFAILELLPKEGEETKFHFFVPIGNNEEIEELTQIALRGFPLGKAMGLESGIWDGTVNGFTTDENGCKYIKTNVDATHGASGGPVFRLSDGKVIGILSRGVANEKTNAASYNMAVDIRQIYSLTDLKIITNESN